MQARSGMKVPWASYTVRPTTRQAAVDLLRSSLISHARSRVMVACAAPAELLTAPFDFVLLADLYEGGAVDPLSLLPRLAPEAWLADRGRPAAGEFINQASRRRVETTDRDVRVYRLLTR
jgi:hypothetical protein